MLIETQTYRNDKPGPRNQTTAAQTLVIPAMIAALLMAAALTGCSTAPSTQQRGILIHAEAVGQDNGNLTGSFPTPHRAERQRNVLYASAATHTGLAH